MARLHSDTSDGFGIFQSNCDQKSTSKKYVQKYLKVYNPALLSSKYALVLLL